MDELLGDPAVLPHLEDVARLLLACSCGAIVGWDREARGRPAGLRTHILVALGACGFMVLAGHLAANVAEAGVAEVTVDPGRVVAAVVGGIGFLGAGAIIHAGGSVRGLTTAAGLWVTAAIGGSLGAGAYVLGGSLTVLAFLVIALLRLLEGKAAEADPAELPGSEKGGEKSEKGGEQE